jgi:hypothetical protein
MDEQGLPYSLEREVPAGGQTALALARELGIPPDRVEAVFRDGRVINIHDLVYAGDRVALFPYGTPGPYRVFLGMLRENLDRARRESAAVDEDEAR